MEKDLKITLSVDAKTGEVTAVRNSFDKLDRKVEKTNKTLGGMKGKILAVAGAAGAIYGLGKAFGFVVRSGYEYNMQMDASTAKLTAMISASKGYVTVGGEQVTAMQRQKLVAAEVSEMMEILKGTNAQTAMGMSELVDVYALAKPGMDAYKWSVKDQIEIVKLASNTASNFGMTAEELSSGIDDLAAGTWEASSGFGKMMKSIKVSKEEYKAAGDKVAYLEEKMKETGAAQDTMAVATSNFRVAWEEMAGQVTQPLFDGVKKALNIVTIQMNKSGPDAMQVFANALVDMVNAGVKSMGFLAKAINQVIGVMQIAYSGYQKYAGLVMGGDISKVKAEITELQRIKKEGDYGLFSNQNRGVVNAEIASLKKKIESYKEWNNVRREGDKNHEEALKRTEAIHKLISEGVEKIKLKRGDIATPVKDAIEPTNKLAYKMSKLEKETGKTGKALKKQTKALGSQAKAADALYKKYLQLTGDDLGLFQLDVSETMEEFIASGEYSAEELSKIYDGMWDAYANKGKNANSEIAMDFTDQFKGLLDGLFRGDLGGAIKGFFDGISTKLVAPFVKSMSEKIGSGITKLLGNGGSLFGIDGLGGALIGGAMTLLGGLFSSEVSQSEIDLAKGRTEFSDDSLKNLESVFEEAQYPMLEVTNKMHKHIRSMDANFDTVARSLNAQASGGGVDLTGVNFVDTVQSGFLGFSSKSISLIGSGLKFELQSLNDIMQEATLNVRAYTTSLVQKSSFWGLKKNSHIRERYKDLPPEIADDIANSFAEGFEAILLAGSTLGLNKIDLEKTLLAAPIDLGKIDFTGLSPSEISDRLSQMMSTALSGVVNGVADLAPIIQRYAKGTEYALETLVRISTEYDQASHDFALIGKRFEEGITKTTSGAYTAQMQILDVVKSAGGLTSFQDAMSSFMSNFYTDAEQVDFMTRSMEDTFSALGIAMPKTNSEFRKLLETLDTGTEEGAYLYGQVLSLADSFNAMTTAAKELDAAVASVATTLNDASLRLEAAANASNFETAMAGIYGSSIDQAYSALETAAVNLDLTAQQVGIFGVNADNYLEAFSRAKDEGLSDEELESWKTLGNSIISLETAYKAATDAYDAEISRLNDILDSLHALRGTLSDRMAFYTSGASEGVTLADIAAMIDKVTATTDPEAITNVANEAMSMIDDYYSQQTAILNGVLDALDKVQRFVDSERIHTDNLLTAQRNYHFYFKKMFQAVGSLDSDIIGKLSDLLTESASVYLDTIKSSAPNTAEYEYQRNVMLNELEGIAGNGDPVVEAIQNLREKAVSWLAAIDAHIQELEVNVSVQINGTATPPPPSPAPTPPPEDDPITEAYRTLLGREPDAPGYQYWSGQVDSGAVAIDEIGQSVATGAAARGEITREELIRILYEHGMGTTPTPEELYYWTYDSLTPLTQLAGLFEQSDARYVPFADGGIVTAPTLGMIGEAGYSEAVIPLKDPSDPLGQYALAAILKEEFGALRKELKTIRDTENSIEKNTRQKRIRETI